MADKLIQEKQCQPQKEDQVDVMPPAQVISTLPSLPSRDFTSATFMIPPKPILQLRSCLIRPYNHGDVQSLAKAGNSLKIARWMRNTFPHPYTTDDARAWILTANSASTLRDFAICLPDGSAVIGGIGLKAGDDIHYRTMELGFWLCEDQWHKGIATEAVTAFSAWAFDRFDLLLRLEAEVFEGNQASGRVLEKAGFVFEARRQKAVEKLGTVMDSLKYCKFRVTP